MTKKTLILLLAILLIIPNGSFALDANSIQSYTGDPDLLYLMETFQYIKNVYPFEVDDKTLIEGGLRGMLQSLDPYSDYYTSDEADQLYNSMLGVFSGIGVYIEEKDSYINIIDTIKDAPGEKSGLKKDDLIISIDGMDIKDISIDDATRILQGPKGSVVKLGIKRNTNSTPLFIEVIRDTISINPVSYEIINNDIGYIKLEEFSQSAAAEMSKALRELDKKGINKIILDIRNNPGGLINQAIQISRQFVPTGPIVHIKEKNKELFTYSSTTQKPKYELVVLVNEYSASASEILAGAIKDRKSGTIIGKKTFGKGIVQSIIPIENGSLIKITTSEYLTPNKKSIHGIGIHPDIIVENTAEEDLQLKEAIKALQK